MTVNSISSKVVADAVEYVEQQKRAAQSRENFLGNTCNPVPAEYQPENWFKEGWIRYWPEHYTDIWPKKGR